MKRIVRGNDFTLRVPVMKIVNGEKVAFPLPGCTDIKVNIVNQYRRVALGYTIDVSEDNVLLARVEGDKVAVGTYALEVKGKLFGNDWRSNEYEQFQLVDNNAAGDTMFEPQEGEDSVEMDTATVILAPSVELTQLIDKANQAIKTSEELKTTLDTNENARKEAETQRATGEAERIKAEKLRVSAENERVKAEDSRVNSESERVKTEKARTEIEIERQANELTRKDNERKRVAAETERVKAEESRITAETKRAAAETEREKAETLRVSAETDRADAESSRVSAETERQKAETKRQADTDTAIRNLDIHRTEFDDAEVNRVVAENRRSEAERVRQQAETRRLTAEEERVSAEQSRVTAETKRKEDFELAIKTSETATAGAEKVNATITDANVLEVTGRDGVKKSLPLVEQAEAATIKTELAEKFDKANIAQELGNAEDKVPSQKLTKTLSDNISDLEDLFNVEKNNEELLTSTFNKVGEVVTTQQQFDVGEAYVIKITNATPNQTSPKFYTSNRGTVVETIFEERLTTSEKTIVFVPKQAASHFRRICYGELCDYSLSIKKISSDIKDNILKNSDDIKVLSDNVSKLNTNVKESLYNTILLDTGGHTSIEVKSDGECVANARIFGYRYNDFIIKAGSVLNIKTSGHNNSKLIVAIYSEKVVAGIDKEKCLQLSEYISATEHNVELQVNYSGYLIFCFDGWQTTPIVEASLYIGKNSQVNDYLYPYKDKKVFFIGDSYTKNAVEHYNKYGKHGYIAAILNKTKMKMCDGTSDVSYSNVCGVSGSQLQRFTPNLLFGVEVFGTKYTYTDVVKNADIVVVFGGTNNYGLGDSNMTLGSFEDKTDDVQIEDVSTDATTLPHTIYGSVKLLVKAIYSLNPTARIIFVTQPERYDDNYGSANVCKLSYTPSDNSVRPYVNAGGLTMGNIAKAIKDCCNNLGVECYDLHSKLWTYQQCLHYLSNDGLHPNSELAWKMGELIGVHINQLIDINDLSI